MKHLMLDIETMGLGQRAALVQIGLVPFDDNFIPYDNKIRLIEIDIRSSVKAGGVVSVDTIFWWFQQGGFKYQLQPVTIEKALSYLSEYLKEYEFDLIWANGTTFDISIIQGYYERCGLPIPWKYNAPRDLRSYREAYYMLGVPELPKVEATHNPVEDCISQINQMRDLYNAAKAL